MPDKVHIVDYGAGNLLSVVRAVEACGYVPVLSSSADEIRKGAVLILPGVGAFGRGMEALSSKGLDLAVVEASQRGCLLLGICLGMQMLFTESEEFGHHGGLNLISGKVVPIPLTDQLGNVIRVPHIGWRGLISPEGGASWNCSPLREVTDKDAFYFVHSYMAEPDDHAHDFAECYYGDIRIAAVVRKENIWGMQFHPEKSGPLGLQLLKNCIEMT